MKLSFLLFFLSLMPSALSVDPNTGSCKKKGNSPAEIASQETSGLPEYAGEIIARVASVDDKKSLEKEIEKQQKEAGIRHMADHDKKNTLCKRISDADSLGSKRFAKTLNSKKFPLSKYFVNCAVPLNLIITTCVKVPLPRIPILQECHLAAIFFSYPLQTPAQRDLLLI